MTSAPERTEDDANSCNVTPKHTSQGVPSRVMAERESENGKRLTVCQWGYTKIINI